MPSDHKVIIDTNVILDHSECLSEYSNILLPIKICEEIDKLSKVSDEFTKYKARQARNALLKADNIEWILGSSAFSLPCSWDYAYTDNQLLAHCKDRDCKLITNDINLIVKAKALGVVCEQFSKQEYNNTYTGFKEIVMNEYDMAVFYECMVNKYGLINNEYLIIKDTTGCVVDRLKWTEKGFKHIEFKAVDSRFVGKVKPRNLEQELYMDLLQDKDIKVKACTGFYGTGKDYLALANFLNLIEKGKYDKIVWVRNNIEAQGTKPVGYLPGSLNEKLSVFADIVCDFVGDKVGFEMLINQGKLELVHTGFLRGRDLKNSIIYCTEAQNMTKELIQLIISRVSDGSMIFFNGDVKQTDSNLFKTNNGLYEMINRFAGNKNFGYVQLSKCERSEIAEMASLLE